MQRYRLITNSANRYPRIVASMIAISVALAGWTQGVPPIHWMAGGHQGAVNAAAVSPRGDFVATGSVDRTVKVWSVATRSLLRTLTGHTDSVNAVAFSGDGRILVSGSSDGTVRCYRALDGVLLRVFRSLGGVTSVATDANGALIAAASGTRVYLLRLSDGALVRIFYGASDTIYSVAFSPNGMLLAAGSGDRAVRIWQVSNGSLLQTLTSHTSSVNAVAFSPDGSMLASGSSDRTVRLWNLSNGTVIRTLQGHTSGISSLSFSANGNLLASGSYDRSIRIWQVSNGTLIATAQGHTDQVFAVAMLPNGQQLFSGARDRTVRVWRATDGAQIGMLTGHTDAVHVTAFSADGALMATAGADRSIRIWRVADGELVGVLTGHTGTIWSLAFSPDSTLLASASEDRTVRIWDVVTRTLVRTLTGHTSTVRTVSFSPDGQRLASAGNDRTIRIWNVQDGTSAAPWQGHTGTVMSVAFSPDGRFLASGAADATVRLWFVENGALLRTIDQHTSWVNSVAFSPDGSLLASASSDQTVRLWQVPNGQPVRTLSGHRNSVYSVAFSPEGSTLFTASEDGTVRLWRAADGALLEVYDREMIGAINSVSVSSDDQFFAYGRVDATAVVAINPYGELGFRVRAVVPSRVYQLPAVVVRVVGSGFEPGATVYLYGETQNIVTPIGSQRISAYRLTATFNFTSTPPGRYSVVVRNPDGREAVLERALEVREGQGEPELFHNIELPTAVRPNRDYVATLTYRNIGQAPMKTPIIVISSPQNLLMRLDPNEPYRREPLYVLAIGENAADRLAPGDGGTVQVHFRSPSVGDEYRIEYRITVDSEEPVNWSSWAAQTRPASVDLEVWSRILTSLAPQLGTTWAQFGDVMRGLAQEHFTNGVKVNDMRALFTFVLDRLIGFSSPWARLADSEDLVIATAPERVTFRRTAPTHLYARFTKGVFGYGWQHNHEYSLLRPRADHIVMFTPGWGATSFYQDNRGNWRSDAGESIRLEEIYSGGVLEGYLIRSNEGTTWRFDANGRLTERAVNRNSAPDITQYEYSGDRLSRILHSGGTIVQIAYNEQGRISRVETNYGNWVQYFYDASGDHLVQIVYSFGEGTQTQTIAYHPEDGSLASHAIVQIQGNRTTAYSYDNLGRITSRQILNSCDFVQFNYPSLISFERTTAEGTERSTYFADGSSIVRYPSGRSIRTTVSANEYAITLPDGNRIVYQLDTRGAPVAVQLPNGAILRTVYNPESGLLERVVTPNGAEYRLTQTQNRSAIRFPDGTQLVATIAEGGRQVTVTTRSGQQIQFQKNAANRITQIQAPDRTIRYTYNERGQLVSAIDSRTGTIQMAYDSRGKLRRIQYPNGAWIEYEYSDYGRRTLMRFHDGQERRYFYDALQRLSRVEDGQRRLIVAYEYGSSCHISRILYGNGTSTNFAYNIDGIPVRVEHRDAAGNLIDFCEYTYDLVGRPIAMRTPTGVHEYVYDAAGQVIGFRRPGTNIVYNYDPSGNRTSVRVNGVTVPYTANALDQYTRVGDATYTYDADGNLRRVVSAQGVYTLEYDSLGQLYRVTTPDGIYEYDYDALGHRYLVRYNGQERYHIHDPAGLGNLVAEYDRSGNLVTRYDHVFGLVSMSNSTGVYYYHSDLIGNIRALTGSGGALVNRYEYGPFGEPLAVQEAVPNPFRYVGSDGVMTEPMGLLYMRARYYDSGIGRFTAPDPLMFLSEFNFYRYAINAPTYAKDPTGLLPDWLDWLMPFRCPRDLQPCPTEAAPPNGCGSPSAPGYEIIKRAGDVFGFTECCNKHDQDYDLGGTENDFYRAETEFLRCMLRKSLENFRKDWQFGLNSVGAASAFSEATTLFGRPIFRCCKKEPPQPPPRPRNGGGGGGGAVFRPVDPNEKRGPQGFGTQGWIKAPDGALTYDVYFENLPSATAWAQEVVITDWLDPDLDRSTFELLDIQVGGQVVSDLVGLQSGRVIVPMQGSDLLMDITVNYNPASGQVRWVIRSIDPVTGDLPPDIDRGLLPPNDPETGSGEGRVSFRIRPRANRLVHGAQFTNQARIVFDEEMAIDTNVWVNTLDMIAPTARAIPRAYAGSAPVRISWTGTDIGSGVRDYTVLVSFNGEPYEVWLENTTETSAVFTPSENGVYLFAVVARDQVGNRGNIPFIPVDVNGDRCVDDADLLLVLFNFGATGEDLATDITGDGIVDDADLLVLLFSFGRGC
jgi:RHS repeat-associated protein